MRRHSPRISWELRTNTCNSGISMFSSCGKSALQMKKLEHCLSGHHHPNIFLWHTKCVFRALGHQYWKMSQEQWGQRLSSQDLEPSALWVSWWLRGFNLLLRTEVLSVWSHFKHVWWILVAWNISRLGATINSISQIWLIAYNFRKLEPTEKKITNHLLPSIDGFPWRLQCVR